MLLLPLFTPQIHLIHLYTPLYTHICPIYLLKCFFYLYLLPKFILFTDIRHYISIFALYTFYK